MGGTHGMGDRRWRLALTTLLWLVPRASRALEPVVLDPARGRD
ncbi:MAG TPA: hypothetical protein VMW17_02275 [Candidatus Binatia bacterium]|nr:hypothetical protein [Candidatus Binatia bacterium]